MEGMDAVMNFTVLRHDDVLSFQVNTIGAWNIMKAAADAGIKKVIHTGPAQTLLLYAHDTDIPVDAPDAPSSDYYFITKHLSNEIVRSFALRHEIHTVCYLFQGLAPRPTAAVQQSDGPGLPHYLRRPRRGLPPGTRTSLGARLLPGLQPAQPLRPGQIQPRKGRAHPGIRTAGGMVELAA